MAQKKHSFKVDEKFDMCTNPMFENRDFLYQLVTVIDPGRIVELGSEFGCSYFTFAQAIVDQNLTCSLVGIDSWEGSDDYGHYGPQAYKEFCEKLDMFEGDIRLEHIKAYFDKAVDKIPDKSVDILLIDGTHTVKAVRQDYEMFIGKLAQDGVVLFHDTNHPHWGVKDFWFDISTRYPSYNHCGRFGLGLLFPKGTRNYNKLVDCGLITDYYMTSILECQNRI